MDSAASQYSVTNTGFIGRTMMPIGLPIIGLGGAWLTVLSPFIAYRLPILIAVAIALVWAWYRVLRP